MRPALLLPVLLAPLADLYLLVVIARHIGGWPVCAFVLASALLGGRMARREGRRVLRDLEAARRGGQGPREGLLSAALLAVAGALLVIPGVVSSLVGLALLIPAVRRRISRAARHWLEGRLAGAVAVSPPPQQPPPPPSPTGAAAARVIDIGEDGRPAS